MTDWDDVQANVELIHTSFAKTLRETYPSLWSRSEAWSNDVFPLSSALTLNLTGGDRDEDVVLTARFLTAPHRLDFDSDISREDGQLLAQGPTSLLELGEPRAQIFAWAGSIIATYDQFLNSKLDLIARELESLNQTEGL